VCSFLADSDGNSNYVIETLQGLETIVQELQQEETEHCQPKSVLPCATLLILMPNTAGQIPSSINVHVLSFVASYEEEEGSRWFVTFSLINEPEYHISKIANAVVVLDDKKWYLVVLFDGFVIEQIGFIATDVFISKDLHKGSIVRLTKYVITDENRYDISNGSKLKKVLLKLTNFAINSYLYLQVMQIIYTNYGSSLLVLTLGDVHKFWKWKQNAGNLSGKSVDKLLSMIWKEKHEHDRPRQNLNADNAYHIRAFLDVPIGQELNSTGRILKNLLDMVSQLH
ncbi:hypothetical protein Tco_0742889, partial [Tanacetum coccineum]